MNTVIAALTLLTGFAGQDTKQTEQVAKVEIQPVRVQYAQTIAGRNVAISIDEGRVRTTFAGRLGFRDQYSTWTSYCANVRAPIRSGALFDIKPAKSTDVGGNVAKAGNIVAKFFKSASTPDQCAGLQLAIWEAVEDGGANPDFYHGKFQARANSEAIAFAEQYYAAVNNVGEAAFLQTTPGGGGQSQITML